MHATVQPAQGMHKPEKKPPGERAIFTCKESRDGMAARTRERRRRQAVHSGQENAEPEDHFAEVVGVARLAVATQCKRRFRLRAPPQTETRAPKLTVGHVPPHALVDPLALAVGVGAEPFPTRPHRTRTAYADSVSGTSPTALLDVAFCPVQGSNLLLAVRDGFQNVAERKDGPPCTPLTTRRAQACERAGCVG